MKRSRLLLAAVALGVLTGCQASSVLGINKAEKPIPRDALAYMKSEGMTQASPIMMRIFKEEEVLEVWKQRPSGKYALVKSYDICAYSGKLGPKFKEGDRQAPEGFYFVDKRLMNPNSSYHLAFNLGFPNSYDRSHGRTGSFLMVHGDCTSAGCYAMTDDGVEEIYAFAREALRGGKQSAFQVQAFPFRMTPENLARYHDHTHFNYWKMLKQGYDHFELTKQPPQVHACGRNYVFNVSATEGQKFRAGAQCPEMRMPSRLASAYSEMASTHALAFEKAVAKLEGRPAASNALKQSIIPEETIAVIEASLKAANAAPEAELELEVEPAPIAEAPLPATQQLQSTPITAPAPAPATTPAPAAAPVTVETTIVETTSVTVPAPTTTSAAPVSVTPLPTAPAPAPAIVTTGQAQITTTAQ
ncbi:MAG: murein L,D-transpeptidase family protein [Pseudomonadota bacterium]